MSTSNQQCFHELNDQRKRNEGCDIIIQIEDKMFPCHRAVLSSWSSYFKAMFDGNFVESESNLITIKEVDRETFDEILEAMYTGKITVSRQNACYLLKACSFLKLHEFQKSCVTFAEQNNIVVDHLIDLCLYADLLKEKKLFIEMAKCIAENFVKLSSNYDFSTLPASVFKAILSQPTLNRTGHFVLLEIVKWIKMNAVDEPYSVFEKLLKKAQLTTVSSSVFGRLLFSTQSVTQVKRVIDEMNDESDSKGTLRITGVGKPTMKVYLRAATQQGSHPDNFISLAYAPENENKWILADVFNSSFDNLKSIRVGRRQYFLSYRLNELLKDCCRFWMIEDGNSTVLSNPPSVAEFFELTELNGIIFLYFSDRSILKSVPNSVEEDPYRLYLYYTDIDEWYPSPKMCEPVAGAAFVGCGYRLCLFGGVCGPNFDVYSQKAHWWDPRCSKWNVIDDISLSNRYGRIRGGRIQLCYGATCVFNGYAYVSGSIDSITNRHVLSSQFLRFSISSHSTYIKLRKITSMGRERGLYNTLTVFNGDIYAIDNNLRMPFSNVEKHSGNLVHEWKKESPLPRKVVSNKGIFYTKNVTATVVESY